MLKTPYPYFGGKAKIAARIWDALGDVPNYVEPFLGGGSVLLARPDWHTAPVETVNDKDGFVSNFWRAVQAEPDAVARYADWPVNENDLHARHAWLTARRESIIERLEGDPDWYDVKIAGWWVWGMACWIGGEFCSGQGPWVVEDGRLVKADGDGGRGVTRQLPHLGNGGRGVKRQRPNLGDGGRGVKRQPQTDLQAYFAALQARLARVCVASGDWSRVVTPATTTAAFGLTGIVLDPPYTMDNRESVYMHDGVDIAADVRAWAIANGSNPLLRIVYCGYDDGYAWPPGWTVVEWQGPAGYQSAGKNAHRERLYLSPACIQPSQQLSLFDV